jgi:hypothetical protein
MPREFMTPDWWSSYGDPCHAYGGSTLADGRTVKWSADLRSLNVPSIGELNGAPFFKLTAEIGDSPLAATATICVRVTAREIFEHCDEAGNEFNGMTDYLGLNIARLIEDALRAQ